MFRNAIRLPFKLLGIPVKLDISFLFILPLFAWLIGSQVPGYVATFRQLGLDIDPAALQGGLTPYLLGLMAALGLFASVLVHELGHALTARLYGVETKEITLWFLGGVAQFTELPRQRGAEAVVAAAGPVVSFALAGLFWWLWHGTLTSAALLFILSYLSITNGFLAVFNLLPALPLDGGRIFRSLLALRLDYVRATRIAAGLSQVIAVLLGLYGFFNFQFFLVILAFFIYNAVRAETQYAVVSRTFENLKVRDLMTREPVTVEPDMRLEQFLQLMFFKKHLGYPVMQDGRLLGFAKLQDAKDKAEDATVADIMLPAETIYESEDALGALRRVGASAVGRLVVLDAADRMVGILSKTDLIRTLQNKETPTAAATVR